MTLLQDLRLRPPRGRRAFGPHLGNEGPYGSEVVGRTLVAVAAKPIDLGAESGDLVAQRANEGPEFADLLVVVNHELAL